MSRSRLWVIIEGKTHDAPFYENLLRDGAQQTVTFLEAEDLEVDGVAAGGKAHGLKVIDRLGALGALEQQNKRTKIDFVLFADRDDDDYRGTLRQDAHVVYTRHADVEAEILAWADLARTTAQTFSVPRMAAAGATRKNYHRTLADLWETWITLRLTSVAVGWSDTRFAQESLINAPKYGPADPALVQRVTARAAHENANWGVELQRAKHQFEAEQQSGAHGRRVKGKWLSPFIVNEVKEKLAANRKPVQVHATTYISSAIAHVNYARCWSVVYKPQLRVILAR